MDIFVASVALSLISIKYLRHRNSRNIENLRQSDHSDDKEISGKPLNVYDVIIVGAGPAGSTAAYYLGQQGYKVALIDKKSFPRPKICGDAWCKPALDLLDEMGILSKMEADAIVNPVKRGGFISPFGYKCINTDGDQYGKITGCKTYAIKRRIADHYIVKAAIEFPSVRLFENVEVINGTFSESERCWTLETKHNENLLPDVSVKAESVVELRGVMCLICDGSTSYLAQKLGILKPESQPEAQCSHTYYKGDTHRWKSADGVMIFNKAVLPGYSALFRHYNDDMYLGTYILPGGIATSRAIAPFEEELVVKHPYVKDAVGSSPIIEEKRVVSVIRCGGVPKSYGQQLFLVGDAAGHVDPLTGEGIHTAMIAAKIAATTIDEMFQKNNFSEQACKAYELRCFDKFGYEFISSSLAARVIYTLPIILDAVAVVGQRKGQWFLDFFGECMTGVRPKSDFCRPDLLIDISIELLRQIVIQYIFRIKPLMPDDIGDDIVRKFAELKKR